MQVREHAAILALLALAVACMPASAQTWDLAELRALAGLTVEQWKAMNGGDPQASVLDSKVKREVAVVGAAHVRATTTCFVTMLRDIENFKKNPAVLQIRKFGRPFDQQSIEGFRLEIADVDSLRNCRLGDCSVKLPVAAMERLGRDVDWSQPDHAVTFQTVVREELTAYLESYLDQGNSALIEYRDKSKPVRLADEFRAVLDARPGLAGLVPEFYEHMARFPRDPSPDVTEFFYWSIETFGLKPVTSITHVSIYVQPGRAVAASKQIYASHYFDASIGLTAALDDPGAVSGPGMYLVYLNRSRIDLLSGFFGGLRRTVLRGRLRDGMRKNLVDVVRKLESSCNEYPKVTPRDQ